MTVAAHTELDVQVASLATRVHGIEEGQRGIITTLQALGTKIDAKGATNWGVIATFCGVSIAGATLIVSVLTVIGGLVFTQVKADQERISSSLVKLDDKFMPSSQITSAIASATALTNQAQANADAAIKDTQERVRRGWDAEMALEKAVVTRPEHEQHWKADDQRFADQQRQLDDVKHVLSGMYDARDVLHDLNERTHQLEARPEARR